MPLWLSRMKEWTWETLVLRAVENVPGLLKVNCQSRRRLVSLNSLLNTVSSGGYMMSSKRV